MNVASKVRKHDFYLFIFIFGNKMGFGIVISL
jgi:hypothetical protein